MMAALRYIWNVAVPDPEGMPSDEAVLRTSIDQARDQLRESFKSRDSAEQVLSQSQAATDRVRRLIAAADAAGLFLVAILP